VNTSASRTGKATGVNADTHTAAGGASNAEHFIHPLPDLSPASTKELVKS
jgi:hypothetical protein